MGWGQGGHISEVPVVTPACRQVGAYCVGVGDVLYLCRFESHRNITQGRDGITFALLESDLVFPKDRWSGGETSAGL